MSFLTSWTKLRKSRIDQFALMNLLSPEHPTALDPNAPPPAARRRSSSTPNCYGAATDSFSAEPEALLAASPLHHGLRLDSNILWRGRSIPRHQPARRSRRHLPRLFSSKHRRWACRRRPRCTRRTWRRRGQRRRAGSS
jgi:hypothetical protein